MARAFFASIIATLIIAALIYANLRSGFLPEFNVLGEIQAFNLRLGLPASFNAAWITFGVVGVLIYGIMFAVLQPILPGSAASEGIWFGVVTAIITMTVVLPLAGRTVFAADQSAVFIASMVVTNLLYGLIVGVAFDAFASSDD